MSFTILATLCRPSALLATHTLRYALAIPTVRRPAMSAAEAPRAVYHHGCTNTTVAVRPTFKISAPTRNLW